MRHVQGFSLCLALALVGAMASSRSADACSYLIPDHRFFLAEAPADGVWWLHGCCFTGEDGEPLATLPLVREDGEVFAADVVSHGVGGSLAVKVPTGAAVGDRFALPDGADQRWDGGEWLEALVVTEGAAAFPNGAVPPPDVRVELRETLVGWSSVAAVPFGDMCGPQPGVWEHHYAERPFLVVDVPEGFVLDVTVRPLGEGAFDEVTSANQIVFDAVMPAHYDEYLSPPPGTVDETSRDAMFSVHARLRRAADGAAGPVVSETVAFAGDSEQRLEWVGCGGGSCSAAGGGASPLLLLGLALLLRRSRSRPAG